MTKKEYIEKHGRSILASKLMSTDWPEDQPIVIIGGQESPDDPRSNLYKALQKGARKEYVVGARRQQRSQGFIIAVA